MDPNIRLLAEELVK
jgi:hypothetical protein